MLRVLSSGERGSPPRMRGKVLHQALRNLFRGITPAHAGKRPSRLRNWLAEWDHPRTCGEKFILALYWAFVLGSPPHMRGKVTCQVSDQNQFGITPAHAGKRKHKPGKRMEQGDHPRTCGEKTLWADKCTAVKGSPPHMRGKGKPFLRDGGQTGITPAHAGKRSSRTCTGFPARDHPRTCGEKMVASFSRFSFMGSPPHMRGKGWSCRPDSCPTGITPAHAGKSLWQGLQV